MIEAIKIFLTQDGDQRVFLAQLAEVSADVSAGRGTNARYSDAMCVLHGRLNMYLKEVQSTWSRSMDFYVRA